MRNITYRIKTILRTLLKTADPVPVKDIADDLRVSRRTVFRELANTESLLQSFGLNIATRPGEGIYIDGAEKNRDSLRRTLSTMGGDEPRDRPDRRQRLALDLLRDAKLQKLGSYAESFGVSVATVSNDLDEIEAGLHEYGLTLTRKSGSGVSVAGSEQGFRRALLAVLNETPGLLAEIAPEENRAINELDKSIDFSRWMTPQSMNAFETYLAVSAQRIGSGRVLEDSEACRDYRGIADQIADFLQALLRVPIPGVERAAISLELAACNMNVVLRSKGSPEYADLLRLAHTLVDAFGSGHHTLLKVDDILIEGLVSYLYSATIRLKHHIEIRDPLAEQMSSGYSELMEETRNAARCLQDIGGGWLPDSEISLLATHFGAAISRINERMRRERDIRVGVVCIHGMGTSYLLCSQARKVFGDEAKFEVGSWADTEGWNRFDFLISTTPIPEARIPVVVVSLLLVPADEQNIRAEMHKAAARKNDVDKSGQEDDFSRRFEAIENLAADAKSIVVHFKALHIGGGTSFPDLARAAGECHGSGPAQAEDIAKCIIERENASTQVLRELNLVFLHCRTDGVARPVFGLVSPSGGGFRDPYFQGVKSGIVMLIPKSGAPEQLEMMGSISTALVDNKIFLSDILAGDAERVRQHTESILERFLQRYIAEGFESGAK